MWLYDGTKKTNTTSTVDSVPVSNKYNDNVSDVGADVVVAQEQNHCGMNELEVRGLEIDEDSYKTNEKLTEQVLTLSRQFRPIDLKNDRILQTNGDATTSTSRNRDENISVISLYQSSQSYQII